MLNPPRPGSDRGTGPRCRRPGALTSGPVPKYRQVETIITERIECGDYTSRLPSAERLAAEFGIDRNTVKRAMRELAESGRVVTVNGMGTFVA